MIVGSFPHARPRRLRKSAWLRRLVAEHHVTTDDLIVPIFIRDTDVSPEIPSFPSVQRYALDELNNMLDRLSKVNIPAVMLFPAIAYQKKNFQGDEAINPEGLMCQAIRKIKKEYPHMGVITDVALDPYTTHGHDGVLINNSIHNDATLDILCQQALVQADAGTDILAPSDMMDGRIGVIRKSLDTYGHTETLLMSYAVKYASSLYTPFRQAVGAPPLQGLPDKKTYQMNPSNAEEALREVAMDIQEGADMVIIKPGLPYLDIVYRVSSTFSIPTCVFHVSGEYACVKAAAQNHWVQDIPVWLEHFVSFKRAGASAIISYAALEVAEWLAQR